MNEGRPLYRSCGKHDRRLESSTTPDSPSSGGTGVPGLDWTMTAQGVTPMEQTPVENPLISEFADDADMIELVEMFVGELPARVAAIQNALKARDLAGVAHVAHQLKGAAGGYGFPTITDAAGELERSAKTTEELDRLTEQVRSVADLCHRARAKPEA